MTLSEMCYIFSVGLNFFLLSIITAEIWRVKSEERENRKKLHRGRKDLRLRKESEQRELDFIYFDILGGKYNED